MSEPTPADTTASRAAVRHDQDVEGSEGTQPLKIAPWVIVLVISNLLAILGGFASAVSWKATVETEMRLGRDRTSEEFAALRGQLSQRTDAIATRLDRYESGQTSAATLQVRVDAMAQQISELRAQVRDLERRR